MITHKQYPNHHIFETEIGGRTFTVETGKVAELCNGECICRYGDTVVLVTAVASSAPKSGIEYFPLTIEFEERLYSVGRIPGAYLRREGRPSEKGILVSRLIDRPMRPFFDDDLRNDVVITCTALANDYENPVEVVASLGAFHRHRLLRHPLERPPWPPQRSPIWTANISSTPSYEQREARTDVRNHCLPPAEKVVMIETRGPRRFPGGHPAGRH